MYTIIQLSDIHLMEASRNGLTYQDCAKKISRAILDCSSRNSILIFAICGDLTSKGEAEGYNRARRFFECLKKETGEKKYFLSVPGNHDITITNQEHDAFSVYNRFIFSLGQKIILSETAAINSVNLEGQSFLLVNSAYHRDHKRGKVNCEALLNYLSENSLDNFIVILHHHLIPFELDKGSSVINSLEILQALSDRSVVAILHGHTHSESLLFYGRTPYPIIGVGSLFFPPDPNFNNTFNLVEIDNRSVKKIIKFRYLSDGVNRMGERGIFSPTEINL
ncbi:MAG: metallophosphoesterase [Magnetococcales bacterium]|nr:metallophosphoesterase [Magnetococcales bacterium]